MDIVHFVPFYFRPPLYLLLHCRSQNFHVTYHLSFYRPVSRPSTAATTTVIDLDDDDFEKMDELDPELASIAAKLNTIASQQSMEGASPLSPSSLSQPFANSTLSQSQSSQPSQSSPSIPAAATSTPSSHGSSNSANAGASTGATGSPHQPSSPSSYHTVLLVIRMNRHPLLTIPPEAVEAQRKLERAVQVTVRSVRCSLHALLLHLCILPTGQSNQDVY